MILSPLVGMVPAKEHLMRVFLATFVLFGIVFAAHAEEYTVPSWPKGINQLPRSAFHKNPDGSWTMTATVHAGQITLSNVTFPGGAEVKMIEAKCGSI
jgi:hypothetical protein